MPFTPPPYTPYPWVDLPSTATPVDAANLGSFGTGVANDSRAVVQAYDGYAAGQFVHQDGTGMPTNVVKVDTTGKIPLKDIPTSKAPWLGLNGNHKPSGTFDGPQNLFSQYGSVMWTRIGQQQGNANDDDGQPLLTTLSSIYNVGQIPVIILYPTAYDTGAPYITGAAVTSYASWFVTQVQAVEAAYPNWAVYEIDNEPWGFYTGGQATGGQYGTTVQAVLSACQTAGLDLTRIYAAIKDISWVPAMYTSQPSLKTLVQGWTMHPYGPPPPGYMTSTSQGIASVPNTRATITGSGANNIIITEVGIYDNSLTGVPLSTGVEAVSSSAQARQWMQAILHQGKEYHDEGWLKALLVYSRDDSGWANVVVNTNGTLSGAGQALVNFPNQTPSFVNQVFSVSAPGVWSPFDDGLVASSMDPAGAGDSVPLTTGLITYIRVRVDVATFVSHITLWLNTAGATLTAGQNWMTYYWQALQSGATAYQPYETAVDMTASFTGATGRLNIPIAGDNIIPGYYWIALLANGTTMPQLAGRVTAGVVNPSNVFPCRIQQTTATATTLPNNVDLSAGANFTHKNNIIFAALSP